MCQTYAVKFKQSREKIKIHQYKLDAEIKCKL